MNKNDLFEVVGNVDEFYLKESEAETRLVIKTFGVGKALAAAASLIIVFSTMLILPRVMFGDGSVDPIDSGEITTKPPEINVYPTDEEVIAAYEAASEAADWFRGSTLASMYGDKNDYIVINGQPYWRVTRFETYSEFDAHLRSLFSDTLTNEFISGTVAYDEQDGKLYSAPISVTPFREYPVSEGQIEDITHTDEDTISVLITVDVYDYADTLDPAPTGDVIGTETISLSYEKIGGKWVFTSFPTLDSSSLEKYQGYAAKQQTEDYYTLNADGVNIPVPYEYMSEKKLTIITGNDEAIITFYYTPEHDRSRYGEILRLYRFSAGEYERRVLAGNIVGNMTALATDGEDYYAMSLPTDVTGDPMDETFAEVTKATRETVMELFAKVNGFEVLDVSEFYAREYTYDSEHKFVRYYPYGKSTNFFYTIVLSQPAKQGDVGIWCVERWYSMSHAISTPLVGAQPSDAVAVVSGNIHIVFPDSGDLSAKEYYARLQEEYENGEHPDLGDADKVVLDWTKSIFAQNNITSAWNLESADDLPAGNFTY